MLGALAYNAALEDLIQIPTYTSRSVACRYNHLTHKWNNGIPDIVYQSSLYVMNLRFRRTPCNTGYR
jgi:hypothetical protein